jgi:hypothetical protein
MARNCPLCGQPLPKGIDQGKLNDRQQKLIESALTARVREIEQDHRRELQHARQVAKQEAERTASREFSELRRHLRRADEEKKLAAERARQEATRSSARNMAHAVSLARRDADAKLEKSEAARERDRLRWERDRVVMQSQFDALSRKLEKQTGQQLGEEGEIDLYSQLKDAFGTDRIERIGRGKRGADIVQHVIDEGNEVARIVFESKNVSVWSKSFITQAKKYRTQYETPHILIVTRAFPAKQKGLCVINSIPLVEPRMAIALAAIIRDGAIEIAKLRLSDTARATKAQELFDYIISDKFRTRFGEMAESVGLLREHQLHEREWHENAWDKESKLHDKLDSCRRQIDVQLRTITRAELRPIARRAAVATA